jgi:hypothetical protein
MGVGEFSYMVRRDVWLAAAPWNTEGGMFDFLRIGCLEARIGRQLNADDFPGDVPMNFRFAGLAQRAATSTPQGDAARPTPGHSLVEPLHR